MRTGFALFLSLMLFLTGAGFTAKRALFLWSAERTNGQVENVTASNSRCGSKNNKYDCTEFSAQVGFTSRSGKKGTISVSSGSARGHNRPISQASYNVGSSVPVVYDPTDVENAFHDSFGSLWGIPLGSFFGSGVFFVSAIFRRRRG